MSPQSFNECVKANGKMVTKKLSGGRYMHICFKDGKSFAGEIKEKKAGAFLKKK